MIPTLMVVFGMTLLEAQAINTANFVSAAIGGWVGGLLCDKYGRARLLQFAGVGHAPTLIADDQVQAVADFLLG
jgi:MFS family permease